MQVKFKKTASILISIFLLLGMFYFAFRNTILNNIILSKTLSYSERFKSTISIEKASFNGFFAVTLENISIVPYGKDTLFALDSIFVKPRFFPLLIGELKIDELAIKDLIVNVVSNSQGNNYSQFFRKKKNIVDTTKVSIPYSTLTNKLLSKLFYLVPKQGKIENIKLKYDKNDTLRTFTIDYVTIANDSIHTSFRGTEIKNSNTWTCEGAFDKDARTVSLKAYPVNMPLPELPFLKSLYGLTLGFDTAYFTLDKSIMKNDELNLKGTLSMEAFKMEHWRIATKPVIVNKASAQYSILISENGFSLDTTTTAKLNSLPFYPSMRYVSRPIKELGIDLIVPKTDAQSLFQSLSIGLFNSIEGIKTQGSLSYKLHFYINSKQPDSLEFNSEFKKENFKIIKYGRTNFAKINSSFEHTAYDKLVPVRTFMVGPENPNYTPIAEVSEYLKISLLTSEDGQFFYHGGFNQDAFRKSIAENFKEKRFKRGGSTVSMQLVKNVFLTRNKTVARKLEEAIIVWLIESNRLVSKERMYEVYLNIIEWGPGIYGIGEASQFYFAKKPSQLNLDESIFLAMIVPRPKGYMYNFEPDGTLKAHVKSYFTLIANHLIRKGVITEEQKNAIVPEINLVGRAKELTVKLDTTQIVIPSALEEDLD